MLRWRIRSALYIDFENVPLPPDAIAHWLAWLEDGMFEADGRSRRFLQKRVYWNSHAERNRNLFIKHGFEPILVGKFPGLKNGADIRMAMDVVEATYTRPEIDEYILLTGDSDFVPVMERLREKAKRSATVVTEHRPNIHTTYRMHADVLIPSRRLGEASHYKRPKPSLFARLFRPTRPSKSARASSAPAAASRQVAAPHEAKPELTPSASPKVVAPPATPDGEPLHGLEGALRRVVKLCAQQPRNYVAQKRIMAELDKVQGFRRQGAAPYLGHASYKALMLELSRRDPRLHVIDQPGGGTGVVFIPPGQSISGAKDSPAAANEPTAATAQDGIASLGSADPAQPPPPRPQPAVVPDQAHAQSATEPAVARKLPVDTHHDGLAPAARAIAEPAVVHEPAT